MKKISKLLFVCALATMMIFGASACNGTSVDDALRIAEFRDKVLAIESITTESGPVLDEALAMYNALSATAKTDPQVVAVKVMLDQYILEFNALDDGGDGPTDELLLNRQTLNLGGVNGNSNSLTVTTKPAGSTVNWAISPLTVATLSSNQGDTVTVTAIANGTATITASISGTALVATVSLTVSDFTTNPGTGGGLTMSKTSLNVYIGSGESLSVTNTTGELVVWSVLPAGLVSFSPTQGDTVTVTGASAGNGTITAKTTSGKTATCSVTVSESASGGSKLEAVIGFTCSGTFFVWGEPEKHLTSIKTAYGGQSMSDASLLSTYAIFRVYVYASSAQLTTESIFYFDLVAGDISPISWASSTSIATAFSANSALAPQGYYKFAMRILDKKGTENGANRLNLDSDFSIFTSDNGYFHSGGGPVSGQTLPDFFGVETKTTGLVWGGGATVIPSMKNLYNASSNEELMNTYLIVRIYIYATGVAPGLGTSATPLGYFDLGIDSIGEVSAAALNVGMTSAGCCTAGTSYVFGIQALDKAAATGGTRINNDSGIYVASGNFSYAP